MRGQIRPRFWAFCACQISFFLNFHFAASPGPGSTLCVPGTGSLYLGRGWGRGRGRGRGAAGQSQDASCSSSLGPCPRQNLCPGGQAGPKGAPSLEPGGLAQPNAPSWTGDKTSSKLSPCFKPGRFTGPQVQKPGCQEPEGNGVSPSRLLPAAQGQRGLLWEADASSQVFFHSLVSSSLEQEMGWGWGWGEVGEGWRRASRQGEATGSTGLRQSVRG